METSSLSTADLLAKLQAAVRHEDDRPQGDEWKSVAEWSVVFGKGIARTGQLLLAGYNKGVMERYNGKIGKHRKNFFRPKQS